MTNVFVDVLGFYEINKKNLNEVDYAQKKIIFLAFFAEKFTCIISAITAQEKMSANIVYKLQFLATNVLIKLKHTHIPHPCLRTYYELCPI